VLSAEHEARVLGELVHVDDMDERAELMQGVKRLTPLLLPLQVEQIDEGYAAKNGDIQYRLKGLQEVGSLRTGDLEFQDALKIERASDADCEEQNRKQS
jgi:hypothetical protein